MAIDNNMKLQGRARNHQSLAIGISLVLSVMVGMALGSGSIYSVLMVIAAGSIIAILFDPLIGLILFMARSELNLQLLLRWLPGANPEMPLVGWGLVAFTLISYIGRKLHSSSSPSVFAVNNIDVGIMAWVFSAMLSWGIAETRGMNVAGFGATFRAATETLFTGIVYFLFRFLVFSSERINIVLDLMIFGAVVRSVDALGQGFFGRGLFPIDYQPVVEELPYKRVSGMIGDPNYMAISLIVPAALVMYRLINSGRRLGIYRRIGLWISVLIILMAIVQSYSRGAWVSVMVIFFALLVKARKKSNALLLGAIIGLTILVTGIEAVMARMTIFLDLSSRLFTSGIALRIWRENWLTGVGPGNYVLQSLSHGGFIGTAAAHNTYAEVLATTGLLGWLTFMYLCYATWKGYLDCQRRSKYLGDAGLHDVAGAMTIGLLGWFVSIAFLSVSLDYRAIPYFALSGVLLDRTRSTVWRLNSAIEQNE
jgi:O-antigen ligase